MFIESSATIVHRVISNAAQYPQQVICRFLNSSGEIAEQLTYDELDKRVRSLAHHLTELDANGKRVLLLYPPGLDYVVSFLACLYSGAIAVPAYPPRRHRADQRLNAIVRDADISLALTTPETVRTITEHLAHTPDLQHVEMLTTGSFTEDWSDQWSLPPLEADSLAFLQYTSGSTSAPKGVMVSHSNLIHNLAAIQKACRNSTESKLVSWLPPYHDMGLISGILEPLYVRFPVTLMDPITFLQRPFIWLQAISESQATISGAPNFAYELCVTKVSDAEKATLDLSNWGVAFNGSEAVRSETLNRFAEAFSGCGFSKDAFFPCYGLAEGTLIVSGAATKRDPVVYKVSKQRLAEGFVTEAISEQDVSWQVSCGQAVIDQQLKIVDPETMQELPPDKVGELWTSGPSNAQGYWNAPELSDTTFHAHLPNDEASYLRTGDLAFIQDGELFVVGRIKDLIIIRGRNYYPPDIERVVEGLHPVLRAGGAAFSVEVDGAEQLVIVYELDRQYRSVDLDLLITSIRQAIVEQFEIEPRTIVLIRPASLPKTSSGKIQHRACRARFLNNELQVIARRDFYKIEVQSADYKPSRNDLLALPPDQQISALETYMREQIGRFVHVSPESVDLAHPISLFGLDSLAAIELQHEVQSTIGVSVSATQFMRDIPLSQLIKQLIENMGEDQQLAPADKLDAATLMPLSANQRGLWYTSETTANKAIYNISRALRFVCPMDIEAVDRTFKTLFERHPMLRAILSREDGIPVWTYSPEPPLVTVQDASSWTAENLQIWLDTEASRPFDLDSDALCRIHLLRRSAAEYILLIVVHHLIADLWSMALFIREFCAVYEAELQHQTAELGALPFQFSDYVRWQTRMLNSAEGENHAEYWRQQLGGELKPLILPSDRPRPVIPSYAGKTYTITLDSEVSRAIAAFAQQQQTTLATVLLTAFKVLLYRYTGQSDVVVGMNVHARTRGEFVNIFGYMVNTLPIRSDINAQMSFADLLKQEKEQVLSALEHQDYPFVSLFEHLQITRMASISPVYQVGFAFQKVPRQTNLSAFILNIEGGSFETDHLAVASVPVEDTISQVDLSLFSTDLVDGTLVASFIYNSDLFEPDTIMRLANHWQVILQGAVLHPELSVVNLPLLTEADRQRLLVDWNDTVVDYPLDKTLHNLFEEQVERTPESIAVVFQNQQFTYRQLNTHANQLAHHLIEQGIGPDKLVGIYMERSLERVVAVLGILKAGGAYVPLDPAYPAERLAFMIADSQVSVLLSQSGIIDHLPHENVPVILLDTLDVLSTFSQQNPMSTVSSSHLAYIIFTSGSTGKPKGTLMPHGVLTNLIQWHTQQHKAARTAQIAALSFDVSFQEMFSTWCNGGTLFVVTEETRHDVRELVQFVLDNQIERLFMTFVMLQQFVTTAIRNQQLPPSLREIIASGDQLQITPEVRQFFQTLSRCRLYNQYGPSENHVILAYTLSESPQEWVTLPPLGRPIANAKIYLLDFERQPVAIGVVGEIYIGGVSVSRGYLNHPELTAEKYMPNPFSSIAGARLYKSGDLARYLPDGNIEFLGRSDHQVKIRGFRIELGELEAVLRQHPAIREAVVIVREDVPGDKRLVAYVIASESVSVAELRDFLLSTLPDYMIPAAFVFLDAFPLSPNRKLDRSALPAPIYSHEGDYVAPRTPTEHSLAAIWQDILQSGPVSIHDNFFYLGGHSLLLMELAAQITQQFNIDVPLQELFVLTDIASQAAIIDMSLSADPDTQDWEITVL